MNRRVFRYSAAAGADAAALYCGFILGIAYNLNRGHR